MEARAIRVTITTKDSRLPDYLYVEKVNVQKWNREKSEGTSECKGLYRRPRLFVRQVPKSPKIKIMKSGHTCKTTKKEGKRGFS